MSGEHLGAPEDGQAGDEFARATFAHVQDLVKVADAKATSLVALQGLVLVIFGSGLADDLARVIRAGGTVACVLGILAAVTLGFTVASMASAIIVLMPREPSHIRAPNGATGLLWIKGLEPFEQNPDGYVGEITKVTAATVRADYAFENLKVGWILRRKFKWLKVAQHLLIPAFLFWVVTVSAMVIVVPPAQ